jgi:hypothetical protein
MCGGSKSSRWFCTGPCNRTVWIGHSLRFAVANGHSFRQRYGGENAFRIIGPVIPHTGANAHRARTAAVGAAAPLLLREWVTTGDSTNALSGYRCPRSTKNALCCDKNSNRSIALGARLAENIGKKVTPVMQQSVGICNLSSHGCVFTVKTDSDILGERGEAILMGQCRWRMRDCKRWR